MVGSTEAQFVQWAPLFGSLSREPRLAGPVEKAASLKLALNQLIAAEISAFALSLGLVQRAGVPIDTFMAILRESALFAPAFEKKLPRLPTRTIISASELSHTSSLEGRGALPEGSLRLRTDGEQSGMVQAGAGADHCARTWRFRLFGHLRGRQPDSIVLPPASLLPTPASDSLAKDRAPF